MDSLPWHGRLLRDAAGVSRADQAAVRISHRLSLPAGRLIPSFGDGDDVIVLYDDPTEDTPIHEARLQVSDVRDR
jgi:hypothetical protein